ncbi:TetR/AcrR family transcriptional regulator [Actinomadura sp. WMMB 499]|uniref:TetR/AcrR family transcriptional regulator n=1 Tax=Actinomadura sp. WMMB 499 TaxID=1219491 RepID=UPI0012473128|nr:TetR/AcrR family transcriptional regulator [Actinomadura sp. WMMB 499]QFG22214.1 TetR/AcrR family transcriptional regulator [Actinomadura sp. WMMB 499]
MMVRGTGDAAADRLPAAVARGDGLTAIMRAARTVFADRGYHGASIRDIAKEAGLSLSALYYYYSGKQDLLHALLEDTLADYRSSCTEVLAEAGDDPAARLRGFVRATVEYRVRRQVDSLLALQETRNLEPDRLESFAERRDALPGLLREIIEDGVAGGLFATPYPDEAQRTILAMCNAIAQWYQPSGGLTVTDLVERYIHMALTLVEYRPHEGR